MHPPQVVIHEVEWHGCGVVLDLFKNAFVRRAKRRINIRIPCASVAWGLNTPSTFSRR